MAPPLGPEAFLGTGEFGVWDFETANQANMPMKVQDGELKKLLMSWYYAGKFTLSNTSVLRLTVTGYYTGLYEGKQQGSQQAKGGGSQGH